MLSKGRQESNRNRRAGQITAALRAEMCPLNVRLGLVFGIVCCVRVVPAHRSAGVEVTVRRNKPARVQELQGEWCEPYRPTPYLVDGLSNAMAPDRESSRG